MVSMNYFLSFSFNIESGAQNYIVLLNLLIGALGCNVILLLRLLDKVKNIAKILQYFLSSFPSFCFNFGYSLILNKFMIFMVEYDDWFLLYGSIILHKFNLLLSPIFFLVIDFFFYIINLIFIEIFYYCFCFCGVTDYIIKTNIIDPNVLKEIELANLEPEQISITDENGFPIKKQFSMRIKNLQIDYRNYF